MTELTEDNCPGVAPKKLRAVNELSDDELQLHINHGRNSKFGASMVPVLELALQKRKDFISSKQRSEELEISTTANKIAESALQQAILANKKSDQARIWSGVAVLASILIAVIGWFLNGG
ncbi:hypothetical protein [Teredinibacter turnerae]|uniref:hypothetical protein n=1 Tax=Teredinibacter turnerae TaxID=2426 RepID=UPI0005F7A0DE|nr:hypothetical protein [Teredinibacter turnerae]